MNGNNMKSMLLIQKLKFGLKNKYPLNRVQPTEYTPNLVILMVCFEIYSNF